MNLFLIILLITFYVLQILVPSRPALGFHHATYVTFSSHFNDLSRAMRVLN
jgi:hypothetical protein